MSDSRTPKCLLFGWFSQERPIRGVKLRWRDKVRQDLKSFSIPETSWYVQAQERSVWRDLCREGSLQLLVASTEPRVPLFECTVCHHQFHRSQDIARHKCDSVRSRTGRR